MVMTLMYICDSNACLIYSCDSYSVPFFVQIAYNSYLKLACRLIMDNYRLIIQLITSVLVT